MFSQEFLDLMNGDPDFMEKSNAASEVRKQLKEAYLSGNTHLGRIENLPEHITSRDPVRCLYDEVGSSHISKDKEREALRRIREILDPLPEDSYVKTAFSGCCQLAEDNINFDWLLSMPARISYLETCLYEKEHYHVTA